MKEKKLSLKQKKMLIIAGIILAVLLVVILVIRAVTGKRSGNGEDVLYADSVGMLTGTGLGTQNRFSGVVEAQDTLKQTLSDDQKVKEIFVEKGQEVKPGTKLYEFDTEELAMTLEQRKKLLADIWTGIPEFCWKQMGKWESTGKRVGNLFIKKRLIPKTDILVCIFFLWENIWKRQKVQTRRNTGKKESALH